MLTTEKVEMSPSASVGALLYENGKLCDLVEIGKLFVSQNAPVFAALVIEHEDVSVILVVKIG